MSRGSGIAHLLQPQRTRLPGKGYAVGGTPINNSLGYGPEYDYVFVPGAMELDPSGKPVYRSGQFARKTMLPTAPTVQDPYARGATGREDSNGSGDAGGDRDGRGSGGRGAFGEFLATAGMNLGSALSNVPGITGLIGRGMMGAANSSNMSAMQAALQADQDAINAMNNNAASMTSMQDALSADRAAEAQAAAQSNQDAINAAAAAADAAEGKDANGGFSDMSGSFGDTSDGIGYANGGLSALGSYSDGGRLLRGPGDGVSDSIPAVIGKKQPARLADGEFVVPARIVSELGNGSTEAGARKLYAMLDRIQAGRKKSIGKGKVATNSRAEKYLPA